MEIFIVFISAKLGEPCGYKVEEKAHLNMFWASDQILLVLLVILDIVLNVET